MLGTLTCSITDIITCKLILILVQVDELMTNLWNCSLTTPACVLVILSSAGQPPVTLSMEQLRKRAVSTIYCVCSVLIEGDRDWSEAAKFLEKAVRCYPVFWLTLWGPLWTRPDRPQPKLMNEQLIGQPQLRLQYLCGHGWLELLWLVCWCSHVSQSAYTIVGCLW